MSLRRGFCIIMGPLNCVVTGIALYSWDGLVAMSCKLRSKQRMIIFRMKGKIWKFPGYAGWHFFTIPKTISKRIKSQFQPPPGRFGSIRVKAKIGTTEWKTSIFPAREGTYLLPLKAAVRKKEEMSTGDTTLVRLTCNYHPDPKTPGSVMKAWLPVKKRRNPTLRRAHDGEGSS